jgi:hypothetical protein
MSARYIAIKAALFTGMAGGTGWFHEDQKCIRIAIDFDFDHFLNVAGGGAFVPEFISAAGPEDRFPFFKGKF